ncbi:ankyrin unc44 [Fusarium heterosporum]|uniref:Ankyrin unc44 n=1 Tax=Fusarium heterosporum TaxID=42747 RepID=A0A8H5TFI0_FUSHE|nr:ankyrin unc44 [Fusarium heterosporum]
MADQSDPNKVAPDDVPPGGDISSVSEIQTEAVSDAPESKKIEIKNVKSTDLQEQLLKIVGDRGSSDEDFKAFEDLLNKNWFSTKTTDEAKKTALHFAAQLGLQEAAEILIGAGADVGAQDEKGQQPLHLACEQGHTDLVTVLLDNKADLEARTKDDRTPLLSALDSHGLNVVLMLLKKGATDQVSTVYGLSTLQMAIISKETAFIKEMVDTKRVNINLFHGRGFWTPLRVAITLDKQETVTLLIENGARLDLQDYNGCSTLMWAVEYGRTGLVDKLLQTHFTVIKSQLEIPDEKQRTPLQVACVKGFSDIASTLVHAKADCNATWPALRTYVPNKVESEWAGWKPLHFASFHNQIEIVKLLIKQADVNAADKAADGKTSLNLASQKGNEEVAKLLLEIPGTETLVNEKDNDGATALHLAFIDPTEEMESVDPDMDSENQGLKESTNLGDYEQEIFPERRSKVIALLFRHGADPRLRTKQGYTAFHQVAAQGDDSLLKLFSEMIEPEDANSVDFNISIIVSALSRAKPEPAIRYLMWISEWREEDWIKLFRNAAKTCSFELLSKLLFQRFPPDDDSGHDEVECHAGRLKPTLKITLKRWHSIQESGNGSYKNLSQILWLLIAASERTPENLNAVQETLKLMKKDAIPELESRGEQPVNRADFFTDLKLSEERKDNTALQSKRQKLAKEDSHFREIFRDIMKDPPLAQMSQTHIDAKDFHRPDCKEKHKDILKNFPAAVVGFYQVGQKSGRIWRNRRMHEIIYNAKSGPANIIKRAINTLTTMANHDAELFDHSLYRSENPRLSWVHLPSTNMTWMNDVLTRIMLDEGYDPSDYRECRSFFRDSWVEVPDRKSLSRFMRPRRVSMNTTPRKDRKNDSDDPEKKGSANKNKKYGSISTSDDCEHKAEALEGKVGIPASAVYMPYLAYSTHCRNYTSLDESHTFRVTMEEYKNLRNLYDREESPQHGSPTLDEWYYQFAEDDPQATRDRNDRNDNQVVSKYQDECQRQHPKECEDGSCKHTVVRVNQLWVWTIANEWIITATSSSFDGTPDSLVGDILNHLAKKAEYGGVESQPMSAEDLVPVIVDYCIGSYERRQKSEGISIGQTFSHFINKIVSHHFDRAARRLTQEQGREETVLFDHFRGSAWQNDTHTTEELRKGHSPPLRRGPGIARDTTSLTKQRKPKHLAEAKPNSEATDNTVPPLSTTQHQEGNPSPTNAASGVVTGDVSQRSAESGNKGTPNSRKESAKTTNENDDTSPVEQQESDKAKPIYTTSEAIEKAKGLCYDIKDVRDELSILKSVAQFQSFVQEDLVGKGRGASRLSSSYVMKDLEELDKIAERIQTAINTTLSLQQNDLAITQGKTVMVFTLATVFFLPLSFLSSLFALDVETFLQTPAWAFYIIFFVSVGISVLSWVAIRHLDGIKKWKVWKYLDRSFRFARSSMRLKTTNGKSTGTATTDTDTPASRDGGRGVSTGVENTFGSEVRSHE